MMAESKSPVRVPIMTPSRGVNPMVVSMDFPFFTAVKETPLPMWQVISLACGFLDFLRRAIDCSATYL